MDSLNKINLPPGQPHFGYIDKLKGLAILTVIMGHFILWPLNGDGDIVLEIIGTFHMPLFMFLSGYVIKNPPSIAKCIAKVKRFLLPVLTIGILHSYFIGSSLVSMLESAHKGGYWFLYVLTLFYFLLSPFRFGRKPWVHIAFAIAVFLALNILDKIVSSYISSLLSIWLMRQYWGFFICGYLFRKFNVVNYLQSKNILYTSAVIGYILNSYLYINGYRHLFYIAAILFITAILYLFIQRENCNSNIDKVLCYIGNQTLDIYIYHYFIIHLTNLQDVGIWLFSSKNIFLEVCLISIYAVVVAYVCIYIGKIMRKSNLIRKLVYGEL